jgi:heme-degrading monooxygenase HmoA
MHTRLATWREATDIDGGIAYLRDTALPMFKQQRGYRGLSASADRSGRTFAVLSIWDTEADRDASASAMGKARDEASKIIGGTARVENLEEVAAEVVQPPRPGAALAVTPIKMDPAKIDDNIAFFKKEVVPEVKASPGFCALRNMIDRATGAGYVGMIWADRPALDRQADARAKTRREAASSRGVTFGEIEYREIVLIDNP